MSNQITITPSKTYATRENAVKAFEKIFGNTQVNYFIATHTDGRFFPVAIGESAVQAGVHFHFNTLMYN